MDASCAFPTRSHTSSASSTGLEHGLKVWAGRLAEETGDGKVLGEQAAVDRWTAAVSRWLVDATLLADVPNLHEALEVLRAAAMRAHPAGPTARLETTLVTLAEFARAGLDRARQNQLADTLDPNSWAARMLVLVFERPHITSADIVTELATHEAQISRSGKALVERGLLVKNRHGRSKGWHVTPRGAVTAQRLTERRTHP
ncbi:MarR family transcriptional regulator [Kibdelosporangium persicum]|uniref:MarR family transcriptional regulator n=1 Tax=Kibdelosporangium persicum TaxID=2698649 RepID=A0ABX2F1S9_9PSEU|nr:MarR family transcriptional regulator [Kibdelosporangium persicum]NRN65182.1 MarR family transcriptional regulator [Kibdelosporangium persicum]